MRDTSMTAAASGHPGELGQVVPGAGQQQGVTEEESGREG